MKRPEKTNGKGWPITVEVQPCYQMGEMVSTLRCSIRHALRISRQEGISEDKDQLVRVSLVEAARVAGDIEKVFPAARKEARMLKGRVTRLAVSLAKKRTAGEQTKASQRISLFSKLAFDIDRKARSMCRAAKPTVREEK